MDAFEGIGGSEAELQQTPVIEQADAVQTQQEQGPHKKSKLRTILIIGAGTAVIAGLTINNACSSDEKNSSNTNEVTDGSKELCSDYEFANAASDPTMYNTNSFMPKAEKVDNSDKTREYVKALFNEDGPLAGNGDQASLAVMMSAVGVPSRDGAATSLEFNYSGAFLTKMAEYQTENGLKAARDDCEVLWDTLNQVSGYNGSWAKKGEQVTLFRAVRDTQNPDKSKQNDVIGLDLVPAVSTADLKGIEFKLRETAKGLDGFDSVLLATNEDGTINGNLYVKGFTKGNVSLNPNGEPLVSVDEQGNVTEFKMLPDGKIEVKTTNKETGEVTVSTSNTGAGTGISVGTPSGPSGPGITGPVGPGTPEGPGVTPTTPGTTPGTQPPRTTVISAPPTLPPITVTLPPPVTQPPTTRPPVTQPPAPTTTRPPAPTTTTTPPWKPPIEECDPNMDVC